MKYLALAVALLMVCGCATSPEHRVDLTIRNKTGKPIRLKATTLILSRYIVLRPGETWTGWWDWRFVGRDAVLAVEEEEPAAETAGPSPTR